MIFIFKVFFRYKNKNNINKSMIDENDINDENKRIEDTSQMVNSFFLVKFYLFLFNLACG